MHPYRSGLPTKDLDADVREYAQRVRATQRGSLVRALGVGLVAMAAVIHLALATSRAKRPNVDDTYVVPLRAVR
jgi:hypothetical protein